MNTEKSIIQQSISRALLGLIVLYSITSTGNIAEFVTGYHKGWTGWTLGIAIGFTLFISAYIAATSQDKTTRYYALFVGLLFGVASATFQTVLYMASGAPIYIAIPLSFVPIVGGEVGLALVEGSYSRAHRENVESEAVKKLRAEHDRLNTLSTEQLNTLNTLHRRVEQLIGELDDLKSEQSAPKAVSKDVKKPVYLNGGILHGLEHLETTEKIVSVAQRMIDSGQKVNKARIAQLLNCSRTTVTTALKEGQV